MSSKTDIIASRYAKALSELAIKNDKKSELEDIYSSFESFVELIKDNDDLMGLLKSPVATREELESVVKSIFAKAKDGNKTFKNFILTCAEHKRLNIIDEIFKAFTKIKDDNDNVTELTIESADELSDQQIDKIKMIARKYSDKDLKIRKKINKNLLGGFVLEFDKYRIDSSLKTKLFKFKNVLKEVA